MPRARPPFRGEEQGSSRHTLTCMSSWCQFVQRKLTDLGTCVEPFEGSECLPVLKDQERA